jgi:hypothetical protein
VVVVGEREDALHRRRRVHEDAGLARDDAAALALAFVCLGAGDHDVHARRGPLPAGEHLTGLALAFILPAAESGGPQK